MRSSIARIKIFHFIFLTFFTLSIIAIGCKKSIPPPDNPDVSGRGIDSVSVSPGPGNPPRSVAIDIDNDGSTDFYLLAGENLPGVAVTSLSAVQNFTGFLSDDSGYVAPSDVNAFIDSVSVPRPPKPHARWNYFVNASVVSALAKSGEANGSDFYLGIFLTKPDGVHYGWLKLNVANDGKSIRLKELAYQLKPRTAIKAGEI